MSPTIGMGILGVTMRSDSADPVVGLLRRDSKPCGSRQGWGGHLQRSVSGRPGRAAPLSRSMAAVDIDGVCWAPSRYTAIGNMDAVP